MRYVWFFLAVLLILGSGARAAGNAPAATWGFFGLRLGESPPANLVKPLTAEPAKTATLFSFTPDKPVANFHTYLVRVTRQERVACYIAALATVAGKADAQRLAGDVIAQVRKVHGEPVVARFPNDATAPYHELEYQRVVVFTYIEPLKADAPDTSKWQVTWGFYDVTCDPTDRPGAPPGGPVSKVDGAFGLSLGAVLDPAKLKAVAGEPETFTAVPLMPNASFATYLVALTLQTHRVRSIFAISAPQASAAAATTMAKNVLATIADKYGPPDSTRKTADVGDTTLVYGTVEITCRSTGGKQPAVVLDYTDVRLEDLAACERPVVATNPASPAKVDAAGL